uniref:Uncharacterized protein n=1 Tax=Chelydra serpentina TaxID=8475 RepID=A0A8C3TMW4_CHESE
MHCRVLQGETLAGPWCVRNRAGPRCAGSSAGAWAVESRTSPASTPTWPATCPWGGSVPLPAPPPWLRLAGRAAWGDGLFPGAEPTLPRHRAWELEWPGSWSWARFHRIQTPRHRQLF